MVLISPPSITNSLPVTLAIRPDASITTKVATLTQISDILKKTEQS